jgi:hypothetical protein
MQWKKINKNEYKRWEKCALILEIFLYKYEKIFTICKMMFTFGLKQMTEK